MKWFINVASELFYVFIMRDARRVFALKELWFVLNFMEFELVVVVLVL